MNDVKTAVGNALRADATYLSLMGNPEDAARQTFYLQPVGDLVFPRTVFVLTPAEYDTDLPPELLQSRSTLRVVVWTRTGTNETILDRVIHLLHGSALGFTCVLSSRPQELYDQEIDAYGLAATFDVYYRRARP